MLFNTVNVKLPLYAVLSSKQAALHRIRRSRTRFFPFDFCTGCTRLLSLKGMTFILVSRLCVWKFCSLEERRWRTAMFLWIDVSTILNDQCWVGMVDVSSWAFRRKREKATNKSVKTKKQNTVYISDLLGHSNTINSEMCHYFTVDVDVYLQLFGE